MHFKPINDNILVELQVEEEKTSSGIFLPDTIKKDKPQTGIVVAVGEGIRNGDTGEFIKPQLYIGDEVMFAKYAGTELKMGGKNYLILHERDIYGVFKEN